MQGVSRDELHDQFALLGMVYALLNSIYFWDRYRSRRTDKLGRFSFSFQDDQPAALSSFTGGDARNVFCDSYWIVQLGFHRERVESNGNLCGGSSTSSVVD